MAEPVGRPSPIKQIENSSIIYSPPQETILAGGRFLATAGVRYLIRGYLKLVDSKGYEIGQSPSYGSSSQIGGGTNTWVYRGYITDYTVISETFEQVLEAEERLSGWKSVIDYPIIDFGVSDKVKFRHGGRRLILDASVEVYGGKFSDYGIDEIIYNELRAKPITLRASGVVP